MIEEDRPLVQQKYQESFANLTIFDLTVRVRSPKKKSVGYAFLLSPRRLKMARTIWDGIRLDITELKESEEKFRQIAETIQDVFYVYNAILSNYFILALLMKEFGSYPVNPLSGEGSHLSFLTRIHPEDRDSVMARMERSLINDLDFSLEYRLLLPITPFVGSMTVSFLSTTKREKLIEL